MVLVSHWLLTFTFMSLQSQESQTTHWIPNWFFHSPTPFCYHLWPSLLWGLGNLSAQIANPRGLQCTGCLCEHLGLLHAGAVGPCPAALSCCLWLLCPFDRKYQVPSCVPGSLLDSGVQILNQAYKVPNLHWAYILPRNSLGEGNGTPLQYSCLENPRMEEPERLWSMGSLRVGHDWATSLSLFTFMHWRRRWWPTPVFLPEESQGRRSLVGCRLWGRRVRHNWSDLAAAAEILSLLYFCT